MSMLSNQTDVVCRGRDIKILVSIRRCVRLLDLDTISLNSKNEPIGNCQKMTNPYNLDRQMNRLNISSVFEVLSDYNLLVFC